MNADQECVYTTGVSLDKEGYPTMMNDVLENKRITFELTQGKKFVGVSNEYSADVSWDVLLEDFVTFLEANGYMGVRERISVQESTFMADLFAGGWSGPTHEEDDWK